jgi:biotin-dependent carboxylase-like uncharacterized protein
MVEVIEKGLYTSIQDLGRIGYQKYGVPISGAMDGESAKLSNLISGNEENSAVMEITLQGPKLRFLIPTRISLTGADLSPKINNQNIPLNTSIYIQKGDILAFGKRKFGVRCYLAVAGGFRTESILGSRSFYKGITSNSIIGKGDLLPFNSCFRVGKLQSPKVNFSEINYVGKSIKVSKGPEFEMLHEEQQRQLLTKSFTIGLNNRMAYQLKELIKNRLNSILSSAVLPGTVQLTPSGKLMILMRDCQTTGGYPRVLQLTESAIDCLAQKMKGEILFWME